MENETKQEGKGFASVNNTVLTIPVKKYKGDSMVISLRLTSELLAKIVGIA